MLTSFNLTFFVGICRRCAELLVLHEHVPSEIHESNHDTQGIYFTDEIYLICYVH